MRNRWGSALHRNVLRVGVALVLGVTGGVIVGGAIRLYGSSSDNGAHAAVARQTEPATTPPPGPPPPGPTAEALRQGRVAAGDSAGALATAIALGKVHTPDGAVAAFTSYAAWLIGSPAAAADPGTAIRAVGGTLVNPADAQLLAGMPRSGSDRFAASHGAYRILGHAGDANIPDEVMIEVTAPLRLAAKTRWSTVGGVVSWTPSGWQLVSIRPTAVSQTSADHDDVHSFTPKERSATLAGLGWQSFAHAEGR